MTELPDGRGDFHKVSKKQPDLNWENPKLREKIYEMINW
nr:trehalose_treC [uncultured bacterium]